MVGAVVITPLSCVLFKAEFINMKVAASSGLIPLSISISNKSVLASFASSAIVARHDHVL
jgi:hypothetical protein